MKICSLLLFLLTVSSYSEIKFETYKTPFGEQLPYQIYTPELKEGNKIPIILLLHGAGERGNDNKKQTAHGFKPIIDYCKSSNKPAIIIAPQCPNKMQWVNVKWNSKAHDMPEFPSTPLRLALELLDSKIKSLPVDKSRIYITGLSMGGYGTWDAISRKPQLFAAALPLCGGADIKQAEKLKNLPIWTIHGDKDGAIPVSRSRDIVKALKEAGGKISYTEHPGAGHNIWTRTYSDKKILDWLFSQKK